MTTRKLDLRTARARVTHLEQRLLETRLKLKVSRWATPSRAFAGAEAFVSICAVMAGRGSFLHALDGLGRVWRYNHQTDEWNSIGSRRGGPVAVRAVEPAKEA